MEGNIKDRGKEEEEGRNGSKEYRLGLELQIAPMSVSGDQNQKTGFLLVILLL